jgi:small conductance mechanosensitive channel
MGNINWYGVKVFITNFVLSNQDQVIEMVTKLTQTVIIIILSVIAIRVGSSGIKKFFDKQRQFKYSLDSKRTDTLSTLCESVLRYTVYFVATVTILKNIFGIETTTIITAAGVGGLAIGFGAQGLVKDVISGFFILLEDQFAVGDMITVEGMMGKVEEMGLRITKIRHYAGDLFIIPNGEIKKVTNHTRGEKGAIIDVSVAYEENIDKVFDVLKELCIKAGSEIDSIVDGPTVLGVTDIRDSGVGIRIFAKTIAGEQWAVERQIRKLIKDAFDRNNIEIPYKRIVIIDKNKDDGI